MKLLVKLQLVDNFVNHFSLCSNGETHQIQVLSFDTAVLCQEGLPDCHESFARLNFYSHSLSLY